MQDLVDMGARAPSGQNGAISAVLATGFGPDSKCLRGQSALAAAATGPCMSSAYKGCELSASTGPEAAPVYLTRRDSFSM